MRRAWILLLVVVPLACDAKSKTTATNLEQLRSQLKSSDPMARRQAAEAIGKLGPAAASALDDLVAVLFDSDDVVRVNAATAIWSMGKEAKPALAALARATKDRNSDVRL